MYRNIFYQLLLLSCLVLLLSASNTQANPSIQFNGILGQSNLENVGTEPSLQVYPYSEALFKRNINLKLNNIKKEHTYSPNTNILGSYNIQELVQNGFSILSIKWTYYSSYNLGLYIADQNSRVTGYCLMNNNFYIQDFLSQAPIQQIQSLPENSHYLENRFNFPSQKLHLKFHEKVSSEFTEIYGILSYYSIAKKEEVSLLILDAFYPHTLATNVVEPEIINGLNQILADHESEAAPTP